MSFNLMDMLQGALSESATQGIAKALGSDSSVVSKACNVAVPALMGGLLRKTSTSSGASEVFGMLNQFDGGLLADLAGTFDGGQKQNQLVEQGRGILDNVLQANLGGTTSRIADATGQDVGMIGKLLPMLAPILMSVLGKQKKAAGWDIGQFTSALADQKSLLGKLDPSLTKSLGLTDILDSAEATGGRTVGKVMDASHELQRSATSAKQTASEGVNLLKILLPLILLGALAFLIWKVGFSNRNNSTNSVDTENSVAVDAPVGSETNTVLRQSFVAINNALDQVYDEATAKVAVQRINEMTSTIEKLNLSALSGARRFYTKPVVKALLGPLNRALESSYEVPGVKAILEPAVTRLMDQFSSFED